MKSQLKEKMDDLFTAKLGNYICQSDKRNNAGQLGENDVVGISTQKELIPTKADLSGVGLSSYKLLPPNYFAYVPDTSRRGDKIAIAFNRTESTFLISSIYVVFYVKDITAVDPWYLFMYYNRPEFDRFSRFNSWGSARETFDWEDMCEIKINLPPLPIQQKYVNIYKAMIANQYSYESGLEDLKLACEGYIEDLRRKVPVERIGKYLVESNRRNDIGLSVEAVRGLSTNKELIPTKANMDGVGLESYKTVEPGQIAYVPDTSRRGEKISLGMNNTKETYLVSSIYTVFGTDLDYLLPEYLMLFLSRSEFDRFARFHSWGSARETFDWSEMCDVQIPIPKILLQQAIVNLYRAYRMQKNINEKLKDQIKSVCPVLISGSLKEGV